MLWLLVTTVLLTPPQAAGEEYGRTGGIEIAVVLHATYNTIAFVVAGAVRNDLGQASDRSAGAANAAVVLISCAVVAAVAAVVWFRTRHSGPALTPTNSDAASTAPTPVRVPIRSQTRSDNMTEHLTRDGLAVAYDLIGEGPLVVLAHGVGDSRHAYRFVAPALAAAGYRVANTDVRGCGDSSSGWGGYSRTDIAGDLLAVVRHLGGPAVLIGHSISGGAATIAAATTPDLIAGVIEVAPFTRRQPVDLGGLLRVRGYRAAYLRLVQVLLTGSLTAWTRYLDLAVPVKPADWDTEQARIVEKLREPGRMKVLQAMIRSNPGDAGAQLAHVDRPILVVEGSADPDWPDPRAEGTGILAELRRGIGELAVIDGAGHYPHVETPDQVLALAVPFLAHTLTRA